ncbi:hypothetical protein COU00_00595 [Candidatus Falkowbacteria bacterium CG10_big_fil_rev_8_21_14_0_10_43_11]|uniref:Uncharacterized protein n=1 Tax=Candidatus Falkowbacteria bacterium CG10_big_fil_rev_8_21_14_0_10_43_11 TaxID=1974568 RepID=A0A2M6WMZ0_9BACT|nr:MAG: hypothetical protein COU00_00595 [Candidatus Falkowbacteria bacterium CG10_big_fil_rev_8_21_14_0_10_43_11]
MINGNRSGGRGRTRPYHACFRWCWRHRRTCFRWRTRCRRYRRKCFGRRICHRCRRYRSIGWCSRWRRINRQYCANISYIIVSTGT